MEENICPLPDLIIQNCLPNCGECPGKWKNEYIKHNIICRCKKCMHGIQGGYGLDVPSRQNTYDLIVSGGSAP